MFYVNVNGWQNRGGIDDVGERGQLVEQCHCVGKRDWDLECERRGWPRVGDLAECPVQAQGDWKSGVGTGLNFSSKCFSFLSKIGSRVIS